MSHYEKIPDLLDNLLACSMAEAARRVGISPSLPWKWLVQSRLGKPELQEIEFCGVLAPFHVHYSQNIPALTAMQIQQSAFERARDGTLVDVFFQGQRMFERVLKTEYKGKSDDDLRFEIGEDFERECYETIPTKQWLKPSDALVVKMLESWHRKRYGAHQTVDVNYGGVLRLERPEEQTKIIENKPEVFEEDIEDAAGGGHHLALARPAKDSAELDKWAAAGEFAPAPVTFVNAKGERTELRADIEELRRQAAELKKNGPLHRQPSHHVEIFPADEPEVRAKVVTAEDEEPEPQTLRDHPRAYMVDKLSPPRKPPAYSKEERNLGTGREGIGVGPDPSKIGPHIGFRIPQR
ncbi:MAG: hypothetical protein WAK63_00010 [Xanthobacteraceae bacterium]